MATKFVRKDIDFIGFTDTYVESRKKLDKLLGWNGAMEVNQELLIHFAPITLNISSKFESQIRKIQWADTILYDQAKQYFSNRFQTDLHTFRSKLHL